MTPYFGEPAHTREEREADMRRLDGRRAKGAAAVPEPTDRERLALFLRDFASRLEVYGRGSSEFERVLGVVVSELARVTENQCESST